MDNDKRKANNILDFVANTNTQDNGQRRKGKPPQRGRGSGPNLERLLNEPYPRHGPRERPATHLWKDCFIMREFKNSSSFQYDQGPPGGSGGGSHGPGYGGGSSGSGFQGNQTGHGNQGSQGNQGGYNHQGSQQQQKSGYQSNPKQLNSGQYHGFTTSLCKHDQKLHKRVVNSVEPAVPPYLRWSEHPIFWSREDHPPRVDNPGHLALVVAPQVGGYRFTKEIGRAHV